MEFANYLKQKRIDAQLSQSEVATRLGYTTSQFVSNWERAISQPPIQSLFLISNLYRVSVDEMFEVFLKSSLKKQEADLRLKFEEVKKEI
jgi:transcriptional regulator with XRE-family HTH domain